MEGRRPLVAEVQTLLGPAVQAPEPTRWVTSGLDSSRVGMVVAVLRRRTGVEIGRQDIYAATIGGVRLTEPSIDLALAVALASATADISVPRDMVAIGEVGLAGEIRRVTATVQRLSEAHRLGFRRAIVPVGSEVGDGLPIEVQEASDVRSAIAMAIGG
jgi:DNA repair protein RadA/Sms